MNNLTSRELSRRVMHYLSGLHAKATKEELLDLHTFLSMLEIDYCPCDGCGYRLFMLPDELKEIGQKRL